MGRARPNVKEREELFRKVRKPNVAPLFNPLDGDGVAQVPRNITEIYANRRAGRYVVTYGATVDRVVNEEEFSIAEKYLARRHP